MIGRHGTVGKKDGTGVVDGGVDSALFFKRSEELAKKFWTLPDGCDEVVAFADGLTGQVAKKSGIFADSERVVNCAGVGGTNVSVGTSLFEVEGGRESGTELPANAFSFVGTEFCDTGGCCCC